jgi:uncharacterized RDD family membrane protein YckC
MSERRVSHQESVPFSYAGFWPRVGATVIDFVILLPVLALVTWLFWPELSSWQGADRIWVLYSLLIALIYWSYHAGMECSERQATLGKRALGIWVTDLQGRRISLATATVRNSVDWVPSVLFVVDVVFGWDRMFGGMGLFGFLSLAIALVSCAMVGSTLQKQGWHDMVAGCLVMRKVADLGPPPIGSPPSGPLDQDRYSSHW